MTVTATPARHSTPRPVSSRPAASTPRVDGPAVRRRVLPALLAAHSWWVELLVAVGFYLGYEATRGGGRRQSSYSDGQWQGSGPSRAADPPGS
jgi:hypothetical protein